MEIVEKLGGEIPILGVCLGHQAICAAYGATVTYAKQLMHGKQSETTLDLTSELFQGLPETVPVARYHSLAADEATLPETLKVTEELQTARSWQSRTVRKRSTESSFIRNPF